MSNPITGLRDEPERRYTYGGRVAHLLPFNTDYAAYPYTRAYCGRSPQWPSAWLGSGSYAESELAERLRLCVRCAKSAVETGRFVADLIAWTKGDLPRETFTTVDVPAGAFAVVPDDTSGRQ